METVYKLTDENDQTYGGCQWGEGIAREADGEGEMCTRHWIHAYAHPLLAAFANPIHANLDLATAHLWECEGEVGTGDGLKRGCTRLTALHRVDLPALTTERRVEVAVRRSLDVYAAPAYVTWANSWLDGVNRSRWAAELAESAESARAAAWAAESAGLAELAESAWAAARTAAWAAESAGLAELATTVAAAAAKAAAWAVAWAVAWAAAWVVEWNASEARIIEILEAVTP